ncbi:MAG: hypothetical protein R3C05_14055 [Pirellulaceae bacterium]
MFNNSWTTPKGMTRRHFMSHMAGASAAMAGTAFSLGQTLKANAEVLKKNRRRPFCYGWGWAIHDGHLGLETRRADKGSVSSH